MSTSASPPSNGDGSPPAPPTSTSESPQASEPAADKSPPAPPTKTSPPESSPAPDGSPPAPPTKNSPSPKSSHSGSDNSPPAPPGESSSGSNHKLSPPSSNGKGQQTKSSSSSDGDNSNDVKVGLIVGGVLLFGLITMVIICIARSKKKKKKDYSIDYYRRDDRPQPQDNGRYYNCPPRHSNWNNSPPDHIIELTAGAQGGGPGGWGVPSPPSHRMNYADINNSAMESGPQRPVLPPPPPYGTNKNTFSYGELAIATGNFAQQNMIGQGGFGYVYKGVLPNGKAIAVKSLKSGSGQGEREFQAEVDIISKVHHRYLVSLVGHCMAGRQRMLVYEFVPNDSLEHHLHGKGLPVMDFSTRLKIALGSAKGLAYLHEDCHPKIIHRDIKSANILLDFSFEAKVADFGLARLSSDHNTHVSTRVMGTFGYLAPEYAASGKLTEKSDVFSFGVMLLELITGKRPIDPHNSMDETLVDWARPLMTRSLDDGNYDEIADPLLERNYNTQEMTRMVASAAASIRHSAKKRPKMSQIVRALEGESSLDDLNDGVKPGHSTIYGSAGSSEYSQRAYQSDMKKFKETALSSTEFPTSSELSSNDSRDMTPRRLP